MILVILAGIIEFGWNYGNLNANRFELGLGPGLCTSNANFLTFGQISHHPEIVGRCSNHHSTHLNEADLMNHITYFYHHWIGMNLHSR
jgi:hypothetical protein